MKTYTYDGYSYFNITEIPFDEIEKIDVIKLNDPTQSPTEWYNTQATKPAVLTNGGFYNLSNGASDMTTVDEGVVLSIGDIPYGLSITGNKTVTISPWTGGERDYLSAYPVLIQNGTAVPITYAKELNYNARRTVYAWNSTTLYVITIDLPGMKFEKMQEILLELGVTSAVNLDGGGSTIKIVSGNKVTAQTYVRPVDTAVAVYLAPVTKTIYRVQTGAFSKRANAEILLASIKVLPDAIGAGYANAYIRIVDSLYKVQVGAFSKKENAQRVVTDLKGLGYSAYITTK